jgi:hypothetical protein
MGRTLIRVKCDFSHMKKPRNLVGPAVRKLRYERKLSQAELAAQCQIMGWNVSRDIIAAIEGQIRCVTDTEIVGLTAVLKVCADQLLPRRREALKVLRH